MPNEYEIANHTNGRVCSNGVVILFVFLAQNSWMAHKVDHKTYTSSIIIHRAHCVSFFQKLQCVWVLFSFIFPQCFPLVKTELIWKLEQFMTKTNYIFRLTAHTTADTNITAVTIMIIIIATTATVKIRTTKVDHLTHTLT